MNLNGVGDLVAGGSADVGTGSADGDGAAMRKLVVAGSRAASMPIGVVATAAAMAGRWSHVHADKSLTRV